MKSKYTATKSDVGVWMSNDYLCESVSRMVAIDAMIALDLDPNDFRIRDRIIKGICKRIDGTLDSVNNITKITDWCRDVVYIPTDKCMNLAATVNVVLYDRLAKYDKPNN